MQGYGDAMDNWRRTSEDILRYDERRFEVGLATAETRQLLSNLALPIVLHQQAWYRPAPIDSTFGERMENALASIVVTHDDHERLVPNYSKLGGTVAAAFLGSKVYATRFKAPELDSKHFFVKYTAYSLAGDLATNVAHEMVRSIIRPNVDVYNLHGPSIEDSYYPLSAGAKVVYWARSTYALRVFVQAGLTAGIPTVNDQPQEPPFPGIVETDAQALAFDQIYVAYGNALEFWRRDTENNVRYHGRRLAGGFAEVETQEALRNLAIPLLFNMEPRYVPLGSGYEPGVRFGHALKGLVETRTDSGGSTINFPVLVGTVGAAVLAKEVYYPQLGTPALATNAVLADTIVLNFAVDALYNVVHEFHRHRSY